MGGEKINMKNIVDFNIVESVASGTIAFFFWELGFFVKIYISVGYIGCYNRMDKSNL